MKHHKYYNTVWSERDQEFWWDGTKLGFAVAAFVSSALWINGIALVNHFKELHKSKEGP